MSHMTYGISSWGGVPEYKLQKLFSLQKRCVRLLFGKEFSFDRTEFYETCNMTRTEDENSSTNKTFCLEHTKPLFIENKILSIHNLSTPHTFMELFKIVKYHCPQPVYDLISFSSRSDKFLLTLPKINLDISKQNFVFRSSSIWNKVITSIVLNKSVPRTDGLIVPGSTANSDFTTPVSIVKS